jgi:hypothetical protein
MMTVLREIFPVLVMQLRRHRKDVDRENAQMRMLAAERKGTQVLAAIAAAAPPAVALTVVDAVVAAAGGVAAAKAQASLRLGRRHAVAGTLAFAVVDAMYHQAMMMRAAAAVAFPVVSAVHHQAMMMTAAAAVAFTVVAAMYHQAMMMRAGAAAVVQAAPAVTATVMMKTQAMLRLGRRHTVPSQGTALRVAGLGGLLLGHLLELWIRTIFALSVAKNPALWHFFMKGRRVKWTTSTCVCVKAVLDTATEENH